MSVCIRKLDSKASRERNGGGGGGGGVFQNLMKRGKFYISKFTTSGSCPLFFIFFEDCSK